MRPLFLLLVLLSLAGCQLPPRAVLSPEEAQKRDAEHEAIRQERAHQEYWEWERSYP